ncbi:unnamed protein product [Scytosiphon promiscuus]
MLESLPFSRSGTTGAKVASDAMSWRIAQSSAFSVPASLNSIAGFSSSRLWLLSTSFVYHAHLDPTQRTLTRRSMTILLYTESRLRCSKIA